MEGVTLLSRLGSFLARHVSIYCLNKQRFIPKASENKFKEDRLIMVSPRESLHKLRSAVGAYLGSMEKNEVE